MAKTIFTQKELGDFYNKNFVNIKMDMETEEGKPLVKKYQVGMYPTLLWLDSDGNLVHKTMGVQDAKALIETGTLAADRDNNCYALTKRYEKGERGTDFMQKYLMASSKAGMNNLEAAAKYYSGKKPEDCINSVDAEIISYTIYNFSNPIFQFMLKNKAAFYKVYNKTDIDGYLEYALMREMGRFANVKEDAEINEKKKEIIACDPVLGAKVAAFMDVNMHKKNPDEQKYYNALADYVIKYDFDNSQNLNRDAWKIAELKIDVSKELLNKALKMAKRSVELNENFANVDTYAFILNRIGRKDEALIQAKKSLQLAPEDQKKGLWSATFTVES
jgi:tetratricopeptide (TPR) repeat protein